MSTKARYSELTDAAKRKLDEQVYIWDKKLAGRIVIFGIATVFALPFVSEYLKVSYEGLAMGDFVKFGVGWAIVLTGLVYKILDRTPEIVQAWRSKGK